MKHVMEEIKHLVLAGGMPILGFVLAILIGFVIYPEDLDGASNLVIAFSFTGALVGIFLVVLRMRRLLLRKK